LTVEIHDENYSYENIDDLITQRDFHPKTLEIKAENKNKGNYESGVLSPALMPNHFNY
jgi:hypothetical protein